MRKKLILTAMLTSLFTGCTHTIPVDSDAKESIAGCKLSVIDVRTDRQIITPGPATTYSYPMEIPIEKALLNKACHTSLSDKKLTLLLESAKCQNRGGFLGPEFALRVSVEGFSRPYATIKSEDSGSPMVGSICGHNLSKALDAILIEIEQESNK